MSLTAALHQEQLIAMISCLKKDNHLLQYEWYITQFEWSISQLSYKIFTQGTQQWECTNRNPQHIKFVRTLDEHQRVGKFV